MGSRYHPRQRSIPLDGLADSMLLCCLHFKHHSSYKCQLGRIQKRGLAGEPGLTQTGPQTHSLSGQLLLKGQPHLSSPLGPRERKPSAAGSGTGRLEVGLSLGCPLVCSVATGSPLFSKPQFPFTNHPPAGQTPAWLISDSRTRLVVVAAAVGDGNMARKGSGLLTGDAGTRTRVS